jgi:curli biogenesis system outer membrane secretion channel CsgG
MNIRNFVLLCFLASIIWAEDAPKNLAVLDLNVSDGVTISDSRMIADRLETEMIQGGKYKVLERRRMSDILTEQGFQQTGSCAGTNCEVQIGQLLGVNRILAGSLGKVGSILP